MSTPSYETNLYYLYRKYTVLNCRVVLCKLYLNNSKNVYQYYSRLWHRLQQENDQEKRTKTLKRINSPELLDAYIGLLHTHENPSKYPITKKELQLYLKTSLTPTFHLHTVTSFYSEMSSRVILAVKLNNFSNELGLQDKESVNDYTQLAVKPFVEYLYKTVKARNLTHLAYYQLTEETRYTPLKTNEDNS